MHGDNIFTHVYTHVYTHFYTHAYAHVYAHVYTHVYTQVGYSDVMRQLNSAKGPVVTDTVTVTKHFDYMKSGGQSARTTWIDDTHECLRIRII